MKLSPQVNPMDISQKVTESSHSRRQDADNALAQLLETKKMIQQMRQAKEAARRHEETQERLREQFLTAESGRNKRAEAMHAFNERKFREEHSLERDKYNLNKEKFAEEMAVKRMELEKKQQTERGELLAKKYLGMQKKSQKAVENSRRRVDKVDGVIHHATKAMKNAEELLGNNVFATLLEKGRNEIPVLKNFIRNPTYNDYQTAMTFIMENTVTAEGWNQTIPAMGKIFKAMEFQPGDTKKRYRKRVSEVLDELKEQAENEAIIANTGYSFDIKPELLKSRVEDGALWNALPEQYRDQVDHYLDLAPMKAEKQYKAVQEKAAKEKQEYKEKYHSETLPQVQPEDGTLDFSTTENIQPQQPQQQMQQMNQGQAPENIQQQVAMLSQLGQLPEGYDAEQSGQPMKYETDKPAVAGAYMKMLMDREGLSEEQARQQLRENYADTTTARSMGQRLGEMGAGIVNAIPELMGKEPVLNALKQEDVFTPEEREEHSGKIAIGQAIPDILALAAMPTLPVGAIGQGAGMIGKIAGKAAQIGGKVAGDAATVAAFEGATHSGDERLGKAIEGGETAGAISAGLEGLGLAGKAIKPLVKKPLENLKAAFGGSTAKPMAKATAGDLNAAAALEEDSIKRLADQYESRGGYVDTNTLIKASDKFENAPQSVKDEMLRPIDFTRDIKDKGTGYQAMAKAVDIENSVAKEIRESLVKKVGQDSAQKFHSENAADALNSAYGNYKKEARTLYDDFLTKYGDVDVGNIYDLIEPRRLAKNVKSFKSGGQTKFMPQNPNKGIEPVKEFSHVIAEALSNDVKHGSKIFNKATRQEVEDNLLYSTISDAKKDLTFKEVHALKKAARKLETKSTGEAASEYKIIADDLENNLKQKMQPEIFNEFKAIDEMFSETVGTFRNAKDVYKTVKDDFSPEQLYDSLKSFGEKEDTKAVYNLLNEKQKAQIVAGLISGKSKQRLSKLGVDDIVESINNKLTAPQKDIIKNLDPELLSRIELLETMNENVGKHYRKALESGSKNAVSLQDETKYYSKSSNYGVLGFLFGGVKGLAKGVAAHLVEKGLKTLRNKATINLDKAELHFLKSLEMDKGQLKTELISLDKAFSDDPKFYRFFERALIASALDRTPEDAE